MFQIDEKVIKDSRTLVTIQSKKHEIDHLNGEVFIDKVEKGTLETIKKEGK